MLGQLPDQCVLQAFGRALTEGHVGTKDVAKGVATARGVRRRYLVVTIWLHGDSREVGIYQVLTHIDEVVVVHGDDGAVVMMTALLRCCFVVVRRKLIIRRYVRS